MSGLEEVLRAHRDWYRDGGRATDVRWFCTCDQQIDDDYSGINIVRRHRAHVAAAVTAWLTERLASEDVREAAKAAAKRDAMDRFASDHLADDARAWLAGFASHAALTAVTDALREGAS